MSEHQTKTLTLSDGKVATVRRPKAIDVIRATDAEPGDNRYKFTCALLARIVTLDGKPCVIEEILELYASDIDKLATEAGGDFLSSSAPSSPSSSNGASASRS